MANQQVRDISDTEMDVPALPPPTPEATVDRIGFTTDLVLRDATRESWARECRRMSVQAERLAAAAVTERRDAYLDLAKRWRELAADMDRAGSEMP